MNILTLFFATLPAKVFPDNRVNNDTYTLILLIKDY